MGQLGVIGITGFLGIIGLIWISLKSTPTSVERPPSTSLYIGVWFLSGVISNGISQIYSFIIGYNFPKLFINRDPEVGLLVYFYISSIIISFILIYYTYSRFPRLNFKRVIPYIWGLGLLGGLVAAGQAVVQHKGQITNENDLQTLTISIFGCIFLGILFTTLSLSKLEDKKPVNETSPSWSGIQKEKLQEEPWKQNEKPWQKKPRDQEAILTDPSKKNIQRKNLLEKFDKAKIAIDYDAEAKFFWEKVQQEDETVELGFLEEINQDPKQNLQSLFDKLIADFNKKQNPYDDIEANEALLVAASISQDAKMEFQKAYDLLGDKVNPKEILETIKEKFAPETATGPKLNLFKGWEDQFIDAERSGKISEMLTVLIRAGYQVNEKNKTIVRPAFGDNKPKETKFTDNFNLIRTVAFERKLLNSIK